MTGKDTASEEALLHGNNRSNDSDFSSEEKGLSRVESGQRRSWKLPCAITCLIISCLANIHSWSKANLPKEENDRLCSLYTSQSESPVFRDLDMEYVEVPFNGTFMRETIYRQKPSPEVDEAWKALGADYRPMLIPEGEIAEKAGLHPDLLKVSPEEGGGFLVNMKGLHHLHCLNLLRKTSHWNYDYYKALGTGPFENEDPILRLHTGHCLDIIRQQLMCTIDTDVFGQVWVEGIGKNNAGQAFPDFMTTHKCKNFDSIRKWAFEHQVQEGNTPRFLRRPGDISLDEMP